MPIATLEEARDDDKLVVAKVRFLPQNMVNGSKCWSIWSSEELQVLLSTPGADRVASQCFME